MPASTSSHFDHEAFASIYPLGVENNFWNLARNYVIERELEGAVKANLIKPTDTVLEVGCGTGVVLDYLRRHKWKIFGVELGTPSLIRGLEEVVWTGRAAGDLEEAFRRKVSCILLLDVIEHIECAPAFLAELLEAFPRCRCVIVSVPARREVWSNFDEFNGHFRRYDRRVLAQHLREAGMYTVSQRYFFHSLYFVALLINLCRIRRKVALSATRRPKLDRLVAHWLYFESRIVPSWFPGLSLLATAQRDIHA